MNRILESVIANTITFGIILSVACIVSLEVKREYFFNGNMKVSYGLKVF